MITNSKYKMSNADSPYLMAFFSYLLGINHKQVLEFIKRCLPEARGGIWKVYHNLDLVKLL